MPGAVDWNPDDIKAPTDYARRRGKIWLAGPKAVELGEADHINQIISPKSQAAKFYKYRQTINQRKNIMREFEGEGLGKGPEAEAKAKEVAEQINQDLSDADSEADRREIWRRGMGYNRAAA